MENSKDTEKKITCLADLENLKKIPIHTCFYEDGRLWTSFYDPDYSSSIGERMLISDDYKVYTIWDHKIKDVPFGRDGRRKITLHAHGCKNEYRNFARCVLFSFLPVPANYKELQASHIDEDKKNDCLYNLKWATPSENNSMEQHGERIAVARTGKEKNRPVVEVDENDNILDYWDTILEAQQATGISRASITAVCDGIIPKVKGRIFKDVKSRKAS